MQSIQGYTFSHQIFESARTIVLKAKRDNDNLPVIIKVLNHQYPTAEELHRFEIEFEMTHALQGEKIIDAYAKEACGNSLAMILEDFGGKSLDTIPGIAELPLPEKLELFILITDALSQVHRQNIIHKDIQPGNILWNHETHEVKLIDFGISSIIPKETQAIKNPQLLEGSLSYISPEQTGRMNRSLDYRTDFYSLGVTFYEFLTGELPFAVDNAMELVHCHIAKQAKAVNKINPKIPHTVAKIVEKLMAKNAEERYQSSYGISADLTRCLTEIKRTGSISLFELATNDIIDRFQIPQKLYGREDEIKLLLTTYNKICEGTKALLMISGHSGIGKSSLIHEIHKPITKSKGFFISGKFGQFNRNLPYYAFIWAFQELVRQLLTENQTQIDYWRKELLNALNHNAKLITDVIPELELIIGPQPAVEELLPVETQNRFIIVFRNFVKVFAQKEHPLVIFIDDLQWSDIPSLKLLLQILDDPKTRYLAVIGSYRDNEVNYSHPLSITLEEINKFGVDTTTLTLAPLLLPQITQLVHDTLKSKPGQADDLAALVFEKTGGNPFFVTQFLQNLYEEQLVVYRHEERLWWWDLNKISAMGFTDNVVTLMTAKIAKLPKATQRMLETSACIGPQFDLRMLSIVTQQPLQDVAQALKEAAIEGLIISMTDFGFREGEIQNFSQSLQHNEPIKFRFLHDRVQQAAYGLIQEKRRKEIHFSIGQLMLEHLQDDEVEDNLFDIVNQLNHGLEFVTDPLKRVRLARFNLQAGKKAKSAAAYEPAMIYLRAGISLLSANSWDTDYQTTMELYGQATEAAYLNTQFDEMDLLSQTALFHANSISDKVSIYEYIIHSYFARNRALEAIDTALKVLPELDVRLPRHPNKFHIAYGLLKTGIALKGFSMQQLYDLKEVTLPEKVAVGRILDCLGLNSYTSLPDLFPVTVCKAVHLSLRSGLNAETAFGLAAYGMILCGALENIEKGYQFGELALRIQERPFTKKMRPRTMFMFEAMIRHWKNHLRDTFEPLLYARQLALELGDIQFAAISTHVYCSYSFFAGAPLPALCNEMKIYSDEITHYKQSVVASYQQIFHQSALNLMAPQLDPTILKGDAYDENALRPIHEKHADRTALFILALQKFIACYLLRRYEDAQGQLLELDKNRDSVLGLYYIPLYNFYESLTCLAQYPDAASSLKRSLMKRVKRNQKKLNKWVFHAPMNFQHKYDLVHAEIARVTGNVGDAINFYNRSIDGAIRHKFINEEALANELAGRFYLVEQHMTKVAALYLKQAVYLYDKWGAKLKVNDLTTTYSALLSESSPEHEVRTIHSSSVNVVLASGRSESSSLDLTSIMKASQIFSGEIVLAKLLKTVMNIILENAGAEKGFIILDYGSSLMIEAEADITRKHVLVLQELPVAESECLAISIVNYVARTRDVLIINNATEDRRFLDDKYVTREKPKSILCYPLLNQGILSGILYLENNLADSAFTAQRLEVLNLLSSQIAVSIDNARLYDKLDGKNIQILHLLDATKEMNGARTRIDASRLAIEHLLAIESNLQIEQVDVYFSQNNRQHFTGYTLWNKGNVIESPVPFEIAEDKKSELNSIDRINFLPGKIFLPVLHEEKLLALIEIQGPDLKAQARQKEPAAESVELMEGIVRSLALTLENLESRENSRLAEIGATAASIVHDLKNPIGAIMSFAEMADRDEISRETRHKYLTIIHDEATRMSNMAQEVLEFSSGKLNLSISAIDSRYFLEDITKLLHPIFEKANIEIHSHSAYDGVLYLDVDRMRRVLINFATNARDALVGCIHDNKEFRLTIEAVKDSPNDAMELIKGVTICAADNGPGIPEQIQATLFEPFVTFGKSNGTGLGMAIVKKIVEAHQGSIKFETEKGRGTVFKLFIPLLTPPQATAATLPSQSELPVLSAVSLDLNREINILVAEDNPVNQLLIKNLLKIMGFNCEVVDNGKSAIAALEGKSFDVILMDVEMPELDGHATTRSIRQHTGAMKDIPIIALTGHDSAEKNADCFAAGMNAIVHKPIKSEYLKATIIDALKHRV